MTNTFITINSNGIEKYYSRFDGIIFVTFLRSIRMSTYCEVNIRHVAYAYGLPLMQYLNSRKFPAHPADFWISKAVSTEGFRT
jgi:hypothetical protein